MDRLYRARLATILPHELTWTTPDRCGAALWTPSDAWRMPQREVLANLPVYLNRRAPLVALGWHRVEARHPHDPHLYLAILGVEPAAQGRGTGSALIGAGLERCDAEGVGAFLESSKPENVPFYERHGFRVTDRLRMPRGPRVWLMWRDPR
jgi:GNAT superfamily N-acetyltransferase